MKVTWRKSIPSSCPEHPPDDSERSCLSFNREPTYSFNRNVLVLTVSWVPGKNWRGNHASSPFQKPTTPSQPSLCPEGHLLNISLCRSLQKPPTHHVQKCSHHLNSTAQSPNLLYHLLLRAHHLERTSPPQQTLHCSGFLLPLCGCIFPHPQLLGWLPL